MSVMLVTAALASLAVACARPALRLTPAPRTFTPRDYERVYRTWTRSQDAFSMVTLSDVLHVTATFESWEFRWAYVVRYADDFHLTPAARDRMLRASLTDARRRHRFLVTLAGPVYRESDLTHKRSGWRVLLVDEDGNHHAPIELEKIKRPGAADRTYFPSITPFRQAFRVVFPAQRADGTPVLRPRTRKFTLRFAGTPSSVELHWRVDPATPR
ncbi:MAG: hypothetical protein ACPGUV_08595 [Polyangiales bacterium]